MNSFYYLDDEDEKLFYSFYNHNCPISPSFKKPNDNIPKEELYEAEENPKENKDNSCNIYIEKTTKELSQDNNKDTKKEKEDININLNNNISFKIKVEKEGKEEKSERKKCGRKRLREGNNQNEHNKYSDDNVRRKIKHFLLKYLFIFLNNQIYKKYNGDIGNGIFKKELQTINQSQKSDATINFNISFLKKQLSEIFSDNISGRFTNYPPNHNKNLISQLLNEKDEEKRIYFRKLFGLNFIDCLKHFRGEKHIDILDGLICFHELRNEILEKYKEDGNEYYETLKYYLNNFEQIIYKKRARKSRKNDE